MVTVVTAIQELGIEVENLPGGCTSLCQPVDVGVNKPLKTKIRKAWEEWMIDVGLSTGKTSPPTRELIVQWVKDACDDLSSQVVRNAWRHAPYEWLDIQQQQVQGQNIEQVQQEECSIEQVQLQQEEQVVLQSFVQAQVQEEESENGVFVQV